MSRFKSIKTKESSSHFILTIDNNPFILERSEYRELIQLMDNSIDVGVKNKVIEPISTEAFVRMVAEARLASETGDCEMCGS